MNALFGVSMKSGEDQDVLYADPKHLRRIPIPEEVGGFIVAASELEAAPDGVVLLVSFDVHKFMDNLYQKLEITFTEQIARSVAKRRAEYFAGRYAAKLALERFGCLNFDLQSDERRCPLWPAGVVGSISHTKDKAVCAVWRDTHTQVVGIDIEHWIEPEGRNAVEAQATDHTERSLLAACELSYGQALTMLFSAKESVFKALYPKVGQYFDFSTVKLVAIDVEACTLGFVVNRMLGPYREGFTLTATYRVFTEGVITLVRIGN